ncbi:MULTISPECIES: PD-(D/E)XK motif protein [Cryobacterium]|uniref:PD-(D/E)XK motif protein n=1 Tax=Cryobacterium TaxID=69578 RepID=UPI000CD455A5|nr:MULTISPECIES: PD-(D/E)XK motif protein [Cryobacterium]POH69951.1 hypothetical protein C3B60_02190 [Cryobacterium zongtaii]TFC42961.1 PD-(D/E)XK motif protein [Cryobacterium sp. TMN-39-2]
MSVATSQDLSRAWAVLDLPLHKPIAAYPLAVLVIGRACRVALDSAGVRHLMIPVSDGAVVVQNTASVLGTKATTLVFERGRPESFVDVFCADPDLNREFDEVILDVLDDVATATEPGVATIACISRWRKLFRARLLNALSYRQQLGLFAELTVLCGLLELHPEVASKWWRGPLKETHDFEAPARCFEVKAVGRESDTITIHGIKQMEGHGHQPLDLLVFTIIADPDGSSLQDLTLDAKRLSNSDSHLADLLVRAGLRQYEENQFSTDRFTIAKMNHVPIIADVPRLTELDLIGSELPAGVSAVNYKVGLHSLTPHDSGKDLRSVLSDVCS